MLRDPRNEVRGRARVNAHPTSATGTPSAPMGVPAAGAVLRRYTLRLNLSEYRSKVLGCWMGKNIGGTLGAPFEWRRQINHVDFYTQDLGGEPMPNDDLDIQLLWLVAMEEQGIDIDAHTLAEYWVLYVTPHWCEYGNGKVNMRTGLQPPLCGTVDNLYKHSCGAWIRSEIWACIAPGCPGLAAQRAYEDAILDHGNGEGTYAEVFCAALEAAAFVESDLRTLIGIGLSYIPDECGIAQAVRCIVGSHDAGKTWLEARNELLEHHRGGTHMGFVWCTSQEDQERGFHTGEMGYDAPSNVGLVVLGLLYGEGDFDRTMCTTVNCGEDTDCTGATVGAIFGLINGADAIPERWIAPIGRGIKTICLNLGELGYFGNQLPQDVDDLTRRTEAIAHRVLARAGRPGLLADQATDTSDVSPESLKAGALRERLFRNMNATVHRFGFFDVAVDYGDSPRVRDGEAKGISIRVTNNYKVPAAMALRWLGAEGWTIGPAGSGVVTVKQENFEAFKQVDFTLQCERVEGALVRLAVELTCPGRPTAMLVPVTLLNGNL
jgi:ADP-ribosylglycohydrolase